ncbi:fimbrial protein [Pseudomonas sp. NBRC 111124]|uniref:fimbrial protein n=1 Tax=Pseudomonas sp. NBRC 111124 TaxID=1661039 RepID=UPI00076123A7|nr:fimbrial protein [Pseudomonas sp. NBRC 111124]
MKKLLATAALALGLSSTAFANTGSIHFYGQITSGTCSIDIIDPATGAKLDRIPMGNAANGRFKAINDEGNSRPFAMRVTPGTGCDTSTNDGYVTFTGAYGNTGTAGELHALQAGGATNLGLAIKDNTGTLIANGSESKAYDLDDANPTDMLFYAAYRATAIPVTAGDANTDVSFVFDLK